MSDPQIPYTPPTEPAADPAATPEPTAPVDYSVHPVWGKAVEAIPEVLRGPLYETITTSERESQRVFASDLVIAVGADNEDRELAKPPSDNTQQVERRVIRPMQVLEDHQPWCRARLP